MNRHSLVARALLAAALLPFQVGAADFAVNSLFDLEPDGCTIAECTLREAVIAANNSEGADRILLSAGTYLLNLPGTGEDEAADGDLNITGPLEIVGVGAGVTIIDAAGTGESAIVASESNLVFTLRRLSLVNSDQGGLSLGVGVHTIEDCEISDNGVTSGAGILVTIAAQLTVRRSTIAGNATAGLLVIQGEATLENVTLVGNGQNEIFANLSPGVECIHCTITDLGDSDAAVRAIGGSQLGFANSIVQGTCDFTAGSALNSAGGNVESPGNGCQFDHAIDLVEVPLHELVLGSFGANGGPTRTRVPASNSVVNGAAFVIPTVTTDQRGAERSSDRESGAVERSAAAVLTPLFLDGFQQGSVAAWSAAVP
jgi:CSLREA domain-containing protein